jgi:post-segregation antitoxin (ccd killing protein)
MYKTKKELYEQAKAYGLKNISRLNKRQLEDALLIHLANSFFNDIADNKITIVDVDVKVDVEPLDIEVIDISGN